jgi:hypothetical protein
MMGRVENWNESVAQCVVGAMRRESELFTTRLIVSSAPRIVAGL